MTLDSPRGTACSMWQSHGQWRAACGNEARDVSPAHHHGESITGELILPAPNQEPVMTSTATILFAMGTPTGAPAIILALGLSAAVTLVALAMLVTATRNRMTVTISLGQGSDPR